MMRFLNKNVYYISNDLTDVIGIVKVKGKYITFTGKLMGLYKEAQKSANQALFNKIGKYFDELEPEGWYDGEILKEFLDTYIEASPTGKNALVTMGRNIFPIIKRTTGLPNFKNPLDVILYDSETFLMDHNSDEVSKIIPREIIKAEEGHVILKAPPPPDIYDALLFKGVYLGILSMFGIKDGKVEIIDKKESIFEITW